MEKEFFVKDLSGRGFVDTFSHANLLEWENETDWNTEEPLHDFIDTAEVGDEWRTDSLKITRTK